MMGRTSTPGSGLLRIGPCDFELNFPGDDRYGRLHKSLCGRTHDHGDGTDKTYWESIRGQFCSRNRSKGTNFSLRQFMRSQSELCRVFVRHTGVFHMSKDIRRLFAPIHWRERRRGRYELALTFNGVPFELTPRALPKSKPKPVPTAVSQRSGRAQKSDAAGLLSNAQPLELTPHFTELLQL